MTVRGVRPTVVSTAPAETAPGTTTKRTYLMASPDTSPALDYCTLWVCTDCLMADHYPDEHPDGAPADDRPAPWSLVDGAPADGSYVTYGIMLPEHHGECDALTFTRDDDGDETSREWHGRGDCFCGTVDFTRSDCDGCGSTLGGAREGYTLHYPATVAGGAA